VNDTLISRLKAINGRVLVTGHTGFKGTWMTILLDELGIEWIGISLHPKPDSLYRLINKKNNNEYFFDIRDYDCLKKTVQSINPDYVIHLAAQPLVLDSYLEPRKTFETNVLGTVNLLDILVSNSISKKVIIATTDKVYKENKFRKSYREADAFGGKDPYSWSKIGTEAAVGAWQQLSEKQGKPKIVSVRAGNVIGGGDSSENRLLPDLVKGFITESSITVRNPYSTRPWQHVLDPLSGYLLAIATETKETAFNFSHNSKSLTVKKVSEIAQLAWKSKCTITFASQQDNLETRNLSLNSMLARNKLGWHSKWNQKNAVIDTITWWKSVSTKLTHPIDACKKDIEFLIYGE
jgi:CDP-glucose 4,6-dehydratase